VEGGPEVEVFWVNMKYVHCSLFTLIASTALYHWSTRLVHELTITGETMPQFLPAEFLPRSGLHLSKDRDEFRFFFDKTGAQRHHRLSSKQTPTASIHRTYGIGYVHALSTTKP
jgi:hypothetical protein